MPSSVVESIAGSRAEARQERQLRALRLWLVSIAILVLAMILVGGATRLTDSGLSITEWKPVTGVVPPLSDSDWQEAFDAYRQIPEYRSLKQGMSLDQFKTIYWWEWGHRFLGRLIGVVFLVPFLAFWIAGLYPKAAAAPSRWPLPAWRTARRGRLVHGEERPRRPHRCQPVPARRPSRHRRADLRLHALAHPSASAGEGGAGAIARRGLGRRHRARPHLPPDPGRRIGRRPRRWRRLQHLAGDQWGLGAGRARRARALVPQSVREPADGAVRPPPARLSRGAGDDRPGGLARRFAAPRSRCWRAPTSSSCCRCCKRRSASGPCCSRCRSRLGSRTKPEPCCSSPRRSTISGLRFRDECSRARLRPRPAPDRDRR